MSGNYHEVVIEGDRGRAYGFVAGFLIGRGLAGVLFDMEAEGFDCEPLRERIRQTLHPSASTYHLLFRAEEIPIVLEAVEAAGRHGLRVLLHEDRPVAGARFSFRFAIYSREHANRVRRWFDDPPAGVALTPETRFEETIHSEDRGVEAYAPAHHYELRGQGVVQGDVAGVVELHRLCRDEELVRTDHLQAVLPG